MSLWDEACGSFVQQLREKGEDSVAIENFLQDQASLEDARQSATGLQNDSDRKYGSGESSGKGISAKWIRRIMENLDKFLSFGDVAMTAAPESIGLAWFVIKNVLGAIQNDYKLYELFHTGLGDITDMMVLVRTYDNIYGGHAVKSSGSIFEELSKSILGVYISWSLHFLESTFLGVYISILDFSYAVRKHITGGKRSKLVHALKDTVGASNRVFEEKTAAIQAQKIKIVQYSEAAFQQKTTDKLGNVSGELLSIQRTMSEVYEFQQQSSKEQKEILSELKTSRPPSHREIAVTEYEKNMQGLRPWLEGSAGTISTHIKERENGTCDWVEEIPAYAAWLHSEESAILCVRGEPNSGKSVLAAYVYEKLRNEAGDDTGSVIQYISAEKGMNDDKRDTLPFENTLLRAIYEHALDDTGDEELLQRCNRLVLHPKQRKNQDSSGRSKQYGRSASNQNAGGDNALDVWEASSGLIEALKKRFVLVLDNIDGFSDDEQNEFAKHLVDLKNEISIHTRILVLCRPTSRVRTQLAIEDVGQISITDHNEGDIKLVIGKGLEKVPGISSTEKAEIKDAILEKTGHQIGYVEQVALPFLRTPLRRPISKWLRDLPENVDETYRRHLLQLAPDYRRLLRTALSWTLTARNLPRVEEIMEAYSGTYVNSSTNDRQNRTDEDLSLYYEQIKKAAGPFLEIQDNRYVVLVDAQAIRNFCKSDADKSDGDLEGPTCTKCKNATQINDKFTMSERQEHLMMAITCLKHLNSASFQARHLSDHLNEARSRAEKKRTHGANDAGEQNTNAGAQSDCQTYNNAAGLEESKSEPEDEPTDGAGHPQDTDEVAKEGADEDESEFSNQDQEDMEQLIDETYLDNDDNSGRLRYEILAWFYHVQEAERLWSPSERQNSPEWANLLHEMEQFFLVDTVGFEAWKLAYVPFDSEEWDPVFWSAKYGLLSLAELLFDKGAKVMDTTPAGYSALHIAAEAPNRLDVLRFFLGRGGDLNFESADIIPVFHDWLSDGADAECVEEMLRNGASCSLINQKWKWNALHYFALYGTDKKVLDLLLDMPLDIEKRSNIGVRDDEGETALHKVLSRPKIPMDILKAFLERGADVNVKDDDSEQPLYEAANWGENDAVELIITRVSDVDDENKWGRTALHAAAFAGQEKTVEILLKHGADANRKDKHLRTPLLFACLTGMYDVVQQSNHQATAELLVQEQIKRGATFAQINTPTKRGRTPLREAAARGFVNVVAAILKQMRPDEMEWINHRDERRGRSPLHSAAAHGRADVTALLLQSGADPNLRDGEKGTGMTSLEMCLDRWTFVESQRYQSTIAHLVDASVNEAKDNKLLLATAAIHGSILILQKLANAGVNFNIPDAYGWTPSQLASQFGHTEAESWIGQSIARNALRPTQWTSHKGLKGTTILQDDGGRVSHPGETRVCISADHPAPAGLSFYYYEVEILDAETGEPHDSPTDGDLEQPIVAVGFSTSSAAQLIDFPGWPPKAIAPNIRTWAYHGDDGFFAASDQKKWPRAFGQHYGPGDTVGCGLETNAKEIFFTRNGVKIDHHTFGDFRGRVFPVLGLMDKVQLRTNFGTESSPPFKWASPQDVMVEKYKAASLST